MCTNFQTKWATLSFWALICPKMGRHFKNLSLDLESVSLRYFEHQFSEKNKQLWIFDPQFAQKWILGSEFQKSKSGLATNTSKISSVPIFSQNGQLLIFWPIFGEVAQLRAIFWFKYCWGCCRELSGGWNELVGGGWSWVELGGGGWSLVEVGARFSNTLKKLIVTCYPKNKENILLFKSNYVKKI